MNTFLMAPPEQLTPQAARLRHGLALTAQIVAGALVVLAVFKAGALWNLRVFAQSQELGHPGPPHDPFLAQFGRYAIAVLWPIPGAVGLFFSAQAFAGGKRWWLIVLLGTVGWFGAYFVIAPPQVYYYWLRPVQ